MKIIIFIHNKEENSVQKIILNITAFFENNFYKFSVYERKHFLKGTDIIIET